MKYKNNYTSLNRFYLFKLINYFKIYAIKMNYIKVLTVKIKFRIKKK